MTHKTVGRITTSEDPGELNFKDHAIELLGPEYMEALDKASNKILDLKIPRNELLHTARTIREDIGGLLRGEMRLGRRGKYYTEHMNPDSLPHIDKLFESLPGKLPEFLTRHYPINLIHAPRRLTSLIATSYVLDKAVMDFQPQDASKSPARKIDNIEELSRKMVLVVGATSVGKDTVRAGLIKDIHPNLLMSQRVSGDELLARAAEIGVVMPVKLTGRGRRPDEVDGVSYHYFDGNEGRPSESKLASISQGGEHLAYSYQYSGHMYGFAVEDIPPGVSGKDKVIPGLRSRLEDDNVRMILCGGGTTPEAVHFKQVFPNATVIYLLATPEEQGLLEMEREVASRWWGRGLNEILGPVRKGVGVLETAARQAADTGNVEYLREPLEGRDVADMKSAIPDDLVGFAGEYESKLRGRLIEVMPQVGQAMMVGPKMDFTVVANERGRIEPCVGTIRQVLSQKGVIEEKI